MCDSSVEMHKHGFFLDDTKAVLYCISGVLHKNILLKTTENLPDHKLRVVFSCHLH